MAIELDQQGDGRRRGQRREVVESRRATDSADSLELVLEALAACGLERNGLAKLSRGAVLKLGEIMSNDNVRSTLTLSMFNAVSNSSPDQVERLIETVSSYQGSLPILRSFLIQLGTWDPFLATRRAQIEILPKCETRSVRGVSGQVLTGITYCAYDAQFPGTTTGYLSGKQAITSILEAFNPERISAEVRERVRTRRYAGVREALRRIHPEDLRLADLEADSSLTGELGSKLVARNLEVYQELRKAIEISQSQLTKLLYTGDVELRPAESLKVSSDVGRQFFGWFEEHFKENPNAPVGIQIAFARLRDHDITLTEVEEQRYIQGLVAYQRMNSFISKGTALSGLVKDLAEYDQLPVGDNLTLDEGIERAREQLKERIANSGAELSITEFGSMLDQSSMVEFRREMNRRTLSTYGAEFVAALEGFKFVSLDGDKWRQDALGDSVPMERLKRHLYGAKIGVLKASDPHEAKRALLSQSDFRHIMNAQFLTRLVTDPERFLCTKPIVDFRAMVEGVIVAGRKVKILEAELLKYQTTLDAGALAVTREDIGVALAVWKPVLPIGSGYKPTEVWGAQMREFDLKVTDLREVAQRFRDGKGEILARRLGKKSGLSEEYEKHRDAVDRYAEAGLYVPEMDELWHKLEHRVRDFRPVSELRELVDRASRLVVHPMVLMPSLGAVAAENDIHSTLRRTYISPAAEVALRKFLEIESEVTRVCTGFNSAKLSELRKRIDDQHLVSATIYKGSKVAYPSGGRTISLDSRSFAAIVRAIEHPEVAGIRYLNPGIDTDSSPNRDLEQKIDLIERSTRAIQELGRDWCERAKQLCSRAGAAALRARGLELVDRATFQKARYLSPTIGDRVSIPFVNLVNELMPTP